MGKNILKIIVLAILIFAIVVEVQPRDFKVSRSMTIDAPASAIFKQVNTQRNWEGWSPWMRLDPNVQLNYDGPKSGVGAIVHWRGNSQLGEGTSTITESKPNERILITLALVKPVEGTDTMLFTFTPSGSATEVTWTMEGENRFMGKAMGLLMNCKKMVGEQFEEGLDNLKRVSVKK